MITQQQLHLFVYTELTRQTLAGLVWRKSLARRALAVPNVSSSRFIWRSQVELAQLSRVVCSSGPRDELAAPAEALAASPNSSGWLLGPLEPFIAADAHAHHVPEPSGYSGERQARQTASEQRGPSLGGASSQGKK